MEELKSDSAPEDGAEAAPAARKFSLPTLSRKMVFIIVAAIAVIGLLVGGVAAFVSYSKSKQAAVQAKKKAAAEEALQAEQNAKMRVEAEQLGQEARKAHEAVMSGSALPPVAPPQGLPEVESPRLRPAEAEAGKVPARRPDPAPEAMPAGAAKAPRENSKAPVDSTEEKPAESGAVAASAAVPSASGACALSGKAPGDYGKALAGCLEEFSRLEGRKKP